MAQVSPARAQAIALLVALAARKAVLVEDPSRPPPPSLFVKLWRLLRDAGRSGALATIKAEGNTICNYAVCNIAFDKSNPRALRIARDQARNLISEISASSRQQISDMIFKGLQTGIAPRPMSRILKEMITLNSTQQQYVLNLVEELKAAQAGDLITRFPPRPGVRQVSGFRARVPPGGPNQGWVTKNANRYQRMHHYLRGRTIARSEAHYAANGGQVELWTQAVEKGQLPPDVRRVWITAGDIRVRAAHAEAEGQTAPLEGDYPIGLEPGEEANCRCGQAIAPREGVGVPGTGPPTSKTPPPTTLPPAEFPPGTPMGKKYIDELTDEFHENPSIYRGDDPTVGDPVAYSIMERRGFNGMPQLKNSAYFDGLDPNKVLWRGTHENFYRNYMDPNKLKFTGFGVYGNGTYHAIGGVGRTGIPGENSRLLAGHYGPTVYRSELARGAKSITTQEVRELRTTFAEDFIHPMRDKITAARNAGASTADLTIMESRMDFLKHFNADDARVATYYGYDNIFVNRALIGGGGPDYYSVVLNRGKTIVEVLP